MKKTNTFISILLLTVLVLGFGCKAASTAATSSSSGGSSSKDLFSTNWALGAFGMNYGAGNYTGSQFTAHISIPNGSVCDCLTTINGSQTSGTLSVASCTLTSGSYNCTQDGFNYANGTTYTNSSGTLTICKGGNCNLTHVWH
jgi:hypothetical protein